MNFAKRVVVAVDVQLKMDEVFKKLTELDFLKSCEIHLVQVVPIVQYPLVLSGMTMIFPIEDDRMDIEKGMMEELKRLGQKLFPDNKNIQSHCLFSESPKAKFAEFIKSNNADLVIIAARERHGFFESSFAQYVAKHSSASLMILKPTHL